MVVTDARGVEYHDECSAGSEREAREAIVELGYSIKTLRLKRLKTWMSSVAGCVDWFMHPERRLARRIPLVEGQANQPDASDKHG